ncbi:MAG TPA: bifunctional lysylphosphatidylglycerol flippase/synthetase MprF [Vicinamibacterales bacterium]
MRERIRHVLPAVIGVVLFVVALGVLRRELERVTWHALTRAVLNTPPTALLAAILLTAINYAALTGYDFIAFAYIGKRLPRRQIAATSFLAYAIANNVGFAMWSGASVRYRFYTRWGVTAEELSRIVLCYSVTFWLGLLALGGLSLALSRLPAAEGLPAGTFAPAIGWALVAISVAYVVAAWIGHRPFRLGRFEVALPSPRLALAQLGVSAVEWAVAGAVLYVLLPASDASFLTILGAFLVAQLLGLASHVPGGVGVFEGLMVLLLKPFLSSEQLIPALVVYRAVYYLLPLALALLALVVDEARRRRAQAGLFAAFLAQQADQLTPRVLSLVTFLAGVMLLFSGSTPAAPGRLPFLDRFVPLGVIEISHIVGSMAGASLLLLSQGIARRLDAAYFFTVVATAAGIVASLFKGADYEEAAVLAILLLVLRRVRSDFDRRAALFATRFSPAWVGAVAAALIASVWLTLFAFKHVNYAGNLWWRFQLDAQASRALRGSAAAAAAVLLFAAARLFRRAPPEIEAPSDADLDTAATAIASQRATYPYLVYLRDKAILFDEQRDAFVMYGVQRRTWVALGDPVGPACRIPELIRAFLERCDDYGATPVFYEVGEAHLHHYADFGLTFLKLGEEARVNLHEFCLDSPRASRFRQAIRRLEKDGGTFRVMQRADVPDVMTGLRRVSDDWMAKKSGAEKGFSMGNFDPEYLSRFPVAVVERDGRIQAFANIWPGPDREELSLDLMRYHSDAPTGVMEALFAHMLVWGKNEGYRWFGLGMAPMSGFEHSPVAPIRTRVGIFLYEHGAKVYNFQGLRAYKEKFHPVWTSHYLAYPGGLRLPAILADVSALVAGGYRRIFVK